MHPGRQLVVMHAAGTPVPLALADLNALTVTVPHVKQFLTPIFYEEPWKINPKLTQESLTGIAEDLVRIFHSEAPIVTNFDLVPSFTLEMAASETTRSQISAGKLPEKTTLRGTQGWQMLFDKGTASPTFKWGELTQWPVKDYYDLKFSRMVSSALNKDTPGGCFIRPSIQGQGGTLYRVALRRYEEYANDTGWRFYFTAAPIDIPIFGIGDTTDSEETTNYHLLNVCWYTRRKLILVLYEDAKGKASSAATKPEEKDSLVKDIRDEIANINIQSFIRKIHQPASLEGLLPIKDVQDDQREWIKNVSIIDAYKTEADFDKVIQALAVMKAMNDKYYAASAAGFSSAVAKELNLRIPPVTDAKAAEG
jgi:hypothetical protein